MAECAGRGRASYHGGTMHSMPALVTEESGPLTPVTIEVTSTTCFLEDMTMKTTFSVPYRIANMECEDSDFSGTINEIRVFALHVGDADRKSTRLNSSHTVISYAVFCLKKKKTKQQKYRTRI